MKKKMCAKSDYTGIEISLAKSSSTTTENQENRKLYEGRTFILASILFLPLASVALVGAYGFIMWFSLNF